MNVFAKLGSKRNELNGIDDFRGKPHLVRRVPA
jgi:hypothetical protein